MNRISPARPITAQQPHRKAGFEATQIILFLWLVCLLAGCGSQTESAAVPTATVLMPTSVLAQPTSTPVETATAVPTAAPTETPTVTPTPAPQITPEAENFYYKGVTYTAAGLFEEALASFDQAITLQPDYALAYLERGKLHLVQGQLDKAKSDLQYALELTTDPVVKASAQTLLEQLAAHMTQATPTIPLQATSVPQPTVAIASGPPQEAQMERPFTLPIGHTAHLQESDLSITFLAVLEDSRCPAQVDCFWSGQARITLNIRQGQKEAASFELNTLYSAKQDTISYAGYTIQLIELNPYPENPNAPIPPDAYQAVLIVTGG